MKKRIVITGGPGTGKTLIINSLKKKGFYCFDEVSREIILQQNIKKGDATPWNNILEFSKMLLFKRKEQFKNITENLSFYDRGIPDIIAYLNYKKINNLNFEINNLTKKLRYDKVFFTPFWEDIYIKDNERIEDLKEAKNIGESIHNTYKNLNYHPIIVPKSSVNERTNFIINNL